MQKSNEAYFHFGPMGREEEKQMPQGRDRHWVQLNVVSLHELQLL